MNGTIEKYLTKIREATSRPGIYAYRGQEDSQWPLHSAATRRLRIEYGDDVLHRADFRDKYRQYHRETLVEPARARGFDVEQGRTVSNLQLLAKLQHFGAATGLLDFTWSPLIALWFASQEPECDGQLFIVNTSSTVEMSLVSSDEKEQDVETIFSSADNSPPLSYWEPMLSGDAMSRILRQRSVFIVGRPLMPTESELIKKIQIDKGDKASLLHDLELLDVSRRSLFQDIYGFSESEGVESPLRQIRDPNVRLLQGNQSYQRGDYLKAIEAYSKCLGLAPGVCETYFLRGNAKAARGDHKQAIEDYDKAVSHKNRPFLNFNPDITKVIFNPILFMVYFNRGNAKSVLKQYEGALEDYTKAIEQKFPGLDARNLHFNCANTYADLDKFEEAVSEYDKVVDSGFPAAHFNKGNVLVVLGRFGEARQCYQKSILEGIDETKAAQNLFAVGRIIDRTHGQEHQTHFDAAGVAGLPTLSVAVFGDHSDPESFPVTGNTGNTGNFGGPGLFWRQGAQRQITFSCQPSRLRNEDEG